MTTLDRQRRGGSLAAAMGRILDDDKNLVKASPSDHIKWWTEKVHGPGIDFKSKDNPARVGWDLVHGVEVSTVFGIAPMPGPDFNSFYYFESMVFGLDDELSGEPQYRYQTWDDAVKGHATLVGLVQELMARPKELPPHA